jgi:hypothetical protein
VVDLVEGALVYKSKGGAEEKAHEREEEGMRRAKEEKRKRNRRGRKLKRRLRVCERRKEWKWLKKERRTYNVSWN